MVLVHHHHLRLHPLISILGSCDSNHRRISLHDVVPSMRFRLTRRDLSLRRPLASGSREQPPVSMGTKSQTSTVEPDKDEESKEKEEEISFPPPPEKPDTGDCCGSGCVRCVWDVYQEEMEDYNNLCTSISR